MKKIIFEVTQENAELVAKQFLLLAQQADTEPEDPFLNIQQLSNLIGYKKSSIYGLVQKNKIPYHKKGKLFFLRSEIMEWLKSGKKISDQEVKRKADKYLLNNL